jgi:hypothetical protein
MPAAVATPVTKKFRLTLSRNAPVEHLVLGGHTFSIETDRVERAREEGECRRVPVPGAIEELYVGGPDDADGNPTCDLKKIKAAMARKVFRFRPWTKEQLELPKAERPRRRGFVVAKDSRYRATPNDEPVDGYVTIEELADNDRDALNLAQ